MVNENCSHPVLPEPAWVEIEKKLKDLPSFNKATRILQRLYIGHANEVEMDPPGRVLLPPKLREFAKLDKKIAEVGATLASLEKHSGIFSRIFLSDDIAIAKEQLSRFSQAREQLMKIQMRDQAAAEAKVPIESFGPKPGVAQPKIITPPKAGGGDPDAADPMDERNFHG